MRGEQIVSHEYPARPQDSGRLSHRLFPVDHVVEHERVNYLSKGFSEKGSAVSANSHEARHGHPQINDEQRIMIG